MKSRKGLKILGVIGDPISHSLSPLMHNAALAHLKLPYLYMPFHVKPEELQDFCHTLGQRKIVGFNVTIPHKQTIIPFMASLSREARLIGAVNTVIVHKGKLIGYNTDGAGFKMSLENEANFSLKNKQVIVLGAGGASRAIVVTLGLEGAREVHLVNRTAKRAFDLAHELKKKFPRTAFSASGWDELDPYYWDSCDLLVNASSLGMKGNQNITLPLSKLPAHALVYDIVYNPLETPLLRKSKKLKKRCQSGMIMLLYQGALSFEKWTRKKAPIAVMKKALLEGL